MRTARWFIRSLLGTGARLLGATILLLVGTSLATPGAEAQGRGDGPATAEGDRRVSLTVRDAPLAQALERLASSAQISLVYDSDLVRDRRVYCSIEDARPKEALSCLLRGEDLDFIVTSAGTYVLVTSTRKAPQYGTLSGVVVDEETGEPLPNASVLLADASTGTATDASGLFAFSRLLTGSHRVVVTYVGYETEAVEVTVTADASSRRRIELEAKPVVSEPIVIDGLQQRLPSGGLGHDAFTSDRIERTNTAGTPDVARAAGAMMGVTTGRPLANLYIQGSSSGEHQMKLDGVPVRNPVSLGRLLSAFSPLALGRLTTHKAGFGATHGSHLSGLVELEHDLQRNRTQYVTVQADPVSFNARLQGDTDIAGARTSMMAAARVGMWGLYRDPALEELIRRWSTLDPVLTAAWQDAGAGPTTSELTSNRPRSTTQFYDLHGAARVELDPYRYLYVSGYHGRSSLGADLVLSRPQTGAPAAPRESASDARVAASTMDVPTYDRYAWSNTIAQARYEWLAGARTAASVRAYYSRYASTSSYEMGEMAAIPLKAGTSLGSSLSYRDPGGAGAPDESNRVEELGLEASADVSLSSATHLDLSVDGRYLTSDFRIGNAFIPTLTHEVRTMRWTAAGAIESSVGLNTTLEAGTRLTYVPARQTVYAEPRGAVRYDRSVRGLGDVAVRVAGGLYRQYTNQFDLSRDGATAVVPTAHVWLPVDHSLAPQRAIHLAADGLWRPSEPWSVNLEGYVKWQPRLLSVDYPTLQEYERSGVPPAARPLNQASFIAPSRGRAYGGGVRVEYDTRDLRATASYAYSVARRTVPHRFDDRMLPAPWNEPHRLTLSGAIPLAAGFTAHLQADGVWGRTWGFRQAYYDYLAPTTCTVRTPCAGEGGSGDASSPDVQAAGTPVLPPYDLGAPSEHRLPPSYRIDAGLSYARTWGGIDVQAQVNLINVFDRENVVEWRLQPMGTDTHARIARTLPGRRPVFSLRISY